MVTYKNIRIPKRGGGTRLQRVQVLASGKYKFVKNKARSVKRKVTRSRSKSRSVRKSSSRKGGRRKTARKMTLPLAVIAGVAAMPAVRGAVNNVMTGAYDQILGNLEQIVKKPQDNIVPLVTGLLIHKFVGGSPLNLNRSLANAGVPLIRI